MSSFWLALANKKFNCRGVCVLNFPIPPNTEVEPDDSEFNDTERLRLSAFSTPKIDPDAWRTSYIFTVRHDVVLRG